MSDIPQTQQSPQQVKDDTAWQLRLLPWMIILPTVLIGVFILQATIRMKNFESTKQLFRQH